MRALLHGGRKIASASARGVGTGIPVPTETVPSNLIEVMLAQGSRPEVRSVPSGTARATGPPPAPSQRKHTMARHHRLHHLALAASLACSAFAAQAQSSTVTITGRAERSFSVSGFGDLPAAATPLQTTGFSAERLQDSGVDSVGGLVLLDASVGDSYNAPGYWSIVAVRGFTLDNRFNYRRDGLPINAETAIGLENKDGLEVLKGASGMQAGTSAPGGLVNLTVKRPLANRRSARLAWEQPGSVLAAADIGDRFGADGAFGWRVNLAAERLDPQKRHTEGRRALGAFAGDWRPSPDTLLEAEFESSRQRQPSVTGFSMLGDRVPAASEVDPRLNLNHQPWSQPVVFGGNTGSLRWQQRLDEAWTLTVHAMTQRLRTDDRTAFPYGKYDPNTFLCDPCDRFAADGSFTYWQFISDNERRTTDNLQASASGRLRTGPLAHTVEAGVLQTNFRSRFQDQIFDIAGDGNVNGGVDTPPSPGTTDANTNRTERSTEFFARDAIELPGGTGFWLGLRHTRLHRGSERTSPDSDGSLRLTDYRQSLTTPWLAVSQQLGGGTLLYASWGQGIESSVAPNRKRYTNAGQALPALKSRQSELGLKHASEGLDANVALFEIDRPLAADLGTCDVDASCTLAADGSERHRGLDGRAALRSGAWTWELSAMLLKAERRGSSTASVNGTRPVNVPERTLRAAAEWRVPQWPDLSLRAALVAESDRVVLPYDASTRIPGWSHVDLGARWTQRLGTNAITWRLTVDNATDRRAWKESPYQFGHAYLYPLAPRTWRASADLAF